MRFFDGGEKVRRGEQVARRAAERSLVADDGDPSAPERRPRHTLVDNHATAEEAASPSGPFGARPLADTFVLVALRVVERTSAGEDHGVILGARLSTRYDGHLLRWLLMVILAATALKLLGAPSLISGVIAIVGVFIVGGLMIRDRRRATRASTVITGLSKER